MPLRFPQLSIWALATTLAGCAYVPPGALAVTADPAIVAPQAALPTRIGPAAALALSRARNLEARAAEARFAVARAQGGIDRALPEPQVALSLDRPTNEPAALDAMSGGISLDTMALMTAPIRSAKASAAFDQADAERRWTLAQLDARVLHTVIALEAARRRVAMLKPYAATLAALSAEARSAMAAGDLGIDQSAPLIAAASDTQALQLAAERGALTAEADLRSLLTAGPDEILAVTAGDPPPAVARALVISAMTALGTTRADLLALRHGYIVQDATRAQAVLAQFPAITLGIQGARDNSNLKTLGGTLGISLPIFGSAQHNLDVQAATLAQLKAEYESRLVQSGYEVRRLSAEIDVLDADARKLGAEVSRLRNESESARAAFARGDLSGLAFAPYQTAVIAREAEQIDLWEARWSDWIELNLFLGQDLSIALEQGNS